ncbi:MAG: type II RES/Xre toxin-antitoxin system antitoxin [Thermoanaerobaculia bacterium]
MNTIAATHVAELLGIPNVHSESDLVREIEHGIPSEAYRHLAGLGLTKATLHAILGPGRTLRRRLAQRQRLTPEESDRAVRLARIFGLAEDVFGETEKALRWLSKPKRHLDPARPGITPWQLVATEHGARLVEQRLLQIDHGIFA